MKNIAASAIVTPNPIEADAAPAVFASLWCFCTPKEANNRPKTRTPPNTDRKSTRLNSSHDQISYAVFCLKKKNKTHSPHSSGLFPPLSNSPEQAALIISSASLRHSFSVTQSAREPPIGRALAARYHFHST